MQAFCEVGVSTFSCWPNLIVLHFYDLKPFSSQWPLLYMVMPVCCSYVPFTWAATTFRITYLQLSQHGHNFQVSSCSSGCLCSISFSANFESWHRFHSCELHAQEVCLFLLHSKTAFKLILMNLWRASTVQGHVEPEVPCNIRLSVSKKWHFHALF